MTSCLIGASGFVGQALLRQRDFDIRLRRSTIGEATGLDCDLVVCAAAPAQKWIANADPVADLRNIESLIAHLSGLQTRQFVLISTVDVFGAPIGVDERSAVDEAKSTPYGRHRRRLEQFVQSRFANHLVIRLPGLVGPGLRKNVVFDFLNDNDLHLVDSRSVFQFYPMVNLWFDIETGLRAGLNLLHLTAEPLSVRDVARLGFNRDFVNELGRAPARYDFRSCHSSLFGGAASYQYDRRESLQAIRGYAQSEPRRAQADGGSPA